MCLENARKSLPENFIFASLVNVSRVAEAILNPRTESPALTAATASISPTLFEQQSGTLPLNL